MVSAVQGTKTGFGTIHVEDNDALRVVLEEVLQKGSLTEEEQRELGRLCRKLGLSISA